MARGQLLCLQGVHGCTNPAALLPDRVSIGLPGAQRMRGTMTLRPKAGSTPQKTPTAAGTQQARVKGLCQQEAPGDDVA